MDAEQQQFIEQWLHTMYNRADDLTIQDIRDDVNWMYKRAGLHSPRNIHISNSFIEHEQQLHNKRKTETLIDSINKLVIYDALDQPLSVDALKQRDIGISDPIFDNEIRLVVQQIKQYVSRIRKGGSPFQNSYAGVGLMNDLWMGCHAYAIMKGWLDEDKCADFMRYARFLFKGIWDVVFYKSDVYVCKCPTRILRNKEGRLDSADEAAVQWRKHKGDCYFIRGIAFPKRLWEQVVRKQLPCIDIIGLENIEQRYIAMELYGGEKLLKELDAKLLDKHEKRGYELYGIEKIIEGRILKMLKYVDPSTGRVYVSYVPYEINTAIDGAAWKFQVTTPEYEALRVEG